MDAPRAAGAAMSISALLASVVYRIAGGPMILANLRAREPVLEVRTTDPLEAG